MGTNPANIQIIQSAGGLISCISNAAYYQRVTLSWTILGSTTTVVFSGSGEDVPMKTSNGATSVSLPAARQNFNISALFEFSTAGPNGPFQQAAVKDPVVTQSGSMTLIQVVSEDSTDQDFNDSYLTISYFSLG